MASSYLSILEKIFKNLNNKLKLIKNLILTIRTKGVVATFFAIKGFFKIFFINFFSSSSLIRTKIFDNQMYLDPKDKGISRTLLLFGERELDHKIILEKVLKKNMKIFDIGANIGYYVLMESILIGNKGKILAIEPVPKNMKILKKNLKLNNNVITETWQTAISNKESVKKFKGLEKFFLSSHSNLGRLLSQLELNSNISNYKKKKENTKMNYFVSITMDIKDIINKTFLPDFIRMDVEGSETDILNDLIKIKLKKYPVICFETHTSRYHKNLKVKNKTRNISKMEKTLRKMFKKGYKIKFASTSYQKGSDQLKELGYKPLHTNIRTDDVVREIYKDLSEKDAINLICYKGGLRTILMSCDK